jgi:dienelactone hydrolase
VNASVRIIEGATHGFDSQNPARQFYDHYVQAGRGGSFNVIPSPKDSAEARQEVVSFFVKNLNPSSMQK